MRTPNWDEIEKAVKVVMCITADTMKAMMGFGPKSDAAVKKFLGFSGDVSDIAYFYDAAYLDDVYDVHDEKFLSQITVEGTHFLTAARRCHDLLTFKVALNEVNFALEQSEGPEWLSFLLSTIPSESYISAGNPSWFRDDENSPLRILHDQATAYLSLVKLVDEVFGGTYGTETYYPYAFTPAEIALLGDLNIRYVRNVMGPGDDKPIRTQAVDKSKKYVFGHGLQALEWLAGRKGFNPGKISQTWAHEMISKIETKPSLLAIPCTYAWIHGASTETIATKTGSSANEIHAWLKGEKMDLDFARKIASAAGLDGELYAARIAALPYSLSQK